MTILDAQTLSQWQSILLGEEKWSYLPQVIFKTIVMFLVVIAGLRLIGRRGIMQGVFETLTIIMLGSAAGDPMLYKNVGLLPAILIFVMIGLLYKISNFFVAKYSGLETVVEGRPVRFIKDGRFYFEHFRSEELSKDELFSDLRGENVSHLGQVRAGYLEPGGKVSLFYFPDDQVKYGLPTFPELNEQEQKAICERAMYSCAYCGNTEELAPAPCHECSVCKHNSWVKAINEKRVT